LEQAAGRSPGRRLAPAHKTGSQCDVRVRGERAAPTKHAALDLCNATAHHRAARPLARSSVLLVRLRYSPAVAVRAERCAGFARLIRGARVSLTQSGVSWMRARIVGFYVLQVVVVDLHAPSSRRRQIDDCGFCFCYALCKAR
jgi:hypothetical protein